MATRAKFYVSNVQPAKASVYTGLDENGKGVYEEREVANVHLNVVGGNTDENKQFFASTPSGQITLSIVNKAAADQLVLGKEYYVDFTEAE
jgi:hypothetical protein